MVMQYLETLFDKQVNKLNDKEKAIALKFKNFMFSAYNSFIKPILVAIFMFWLFTKIKDTLGYQETLFIQLTVIIIFLRIISSRLR